MAKKKKKPETIIEELEARRGKSKIKNPEALAAWIGRKKYTKKVFQDMAFEGRI